MGGALDICVYITYSHMNSSPMHFLFRVRRHHQGYLAFVHVDKLVLDVHQYDDY
jgi:hypothetical protein